MYSVTFYSFKGGVGRTTALVNVGVQLAKSGKRVLMVDFDLEAPGLASYRWANEIDNRQGMVEYVTTYRETGEAPDVSQYVHQAHRFDSSGGELWCMPAGMHDSTYSTRLNAIDWNRLYAEEHGYVLFEDLKKQWEYTVRPDYVLIDSRTGHSDVEGICTRQLPDAVCLVFFPNEQNLWGLKRVAASIRHQNEKRRTTRPEIRMHYIASNVPDIDDEESILASRIDLFKRELKFRDLTARIHHYSSLLFVDQQIFSIVRPKTRVVKEYVRLAKAIASENLTDRTAALEFLARTLNQVRGAVPGDSLTETVPKAEGLLALHPEDSEIANKVALIFEATGMLSDALTLLSGSRQMTAEDYAIRARINFRLGDKYEAKQDLERMLDSPRVEVSTFMDAMTYIAQLDENLFTRVPGSVALNSLSRDTKVFVAMRFDASVLQLRVQAEILEALDFSDQSDLGGVVRNQLALASIGLHEFDRAASILRQSIAEEQSADIAAYFNLAMAEWGLTGTPPISLFSKVANLVAQSGRRQNWANYLQCAAITFGVLGEDAEATAYVSRAKEAMQARPREEFSAWAYLRVNPRQFIKHLDELREGILGVKPLQPEVFRDPPQLTLH